MPVKITNIKVSIKIDVQSLDSVEKTLADSKNECKKFNNFIVFRHKFVYTVFRAGKKSTNHVNITKIKEFSDIEESIKKLQSLGFAPSKDSLKVDNITGSISLDKEIHIENIIEFAKSDEKFNNLKITYNNEKFPGIFIKSYSAGTIIIFHSGKVVFVGCKTIEDLECLKSLTHVLTKNS